MPNKLTIGFIILILVVVVLCNRRNGGEGEMSAKYQKPVAILKSMEWIAGTWKQETSPGPTYESWRMINDSLWKGKGFRVSRTDTVLLEKLSLEVIDGEIFYVPVVPHNEGAVYFKMIEQSPNKVKFENPTHDFPQRIIYMKISNDSLHARIEGMNDGVETSMDFYFRRIN